MIKNVLASDGREIEFSDIPVHSREDGPRYGAPIPVMARDEARANTTITVGEWELSYDRLGYCYKRVRK